MATTRLIPLHANKGKTAARTISSRTDYTKNERKTEGGELIRTYECEPRSVDEEFLLAKSRYEFITGRAFGKHDVLAYQIRQSFKPGEITPQKALDVGYETAMRFTGGSHAFIVAVHTDRKHIHSHAIFNSTALDCAHKFKNFWGSSFALRRLSDIICVENGLSVIKNPKPSRGSYGDWLGDRKEPSHKEILRRAIDEILPSATTYGDFMARLIAAGFEISAKGRRHTAKLPGWGRPARLDSLGDEYEAAAIMARLGKAKARAGGGGSGAHARAMPAGSQVNLLVDIQAKIREGKGAGYERWAKIFNLKQAAKTLIFLREQGIDSYEDLKKKSSSASGALAALTKKIRDAEIRMGEIAELQKQIGTYGKTRATYEAYKRSGWSRQYYDGHTADVILHRAAKKFFGAQGFKGRLPSIASLKQEWAALAAEKKKLYAGYHELRDTSRSLMVAKGNADRILGVAPQAQAQETSRGESRWQ
jgi:hypothetical protein